MTVGEVLQKRDLGGVVTIRPSLAPRRVTRDAREAVVVLRDPDRYAASSETADDAEPAIVATDDDRARLSHPRSSRATRCPANLLPATKRMSGPNDRAAGAPTM